MQVDEIIQALGKPLHDPFFVKNHNYFEKYESIPQGDKLLLSSSSEEINLTFDENDILIKIELKNPQKCCEWLSLQSSFTISMPVTKDILITQLGAPKQQLKNPAKHEEEQLLYDKTYYWLNIKIQNNQLAAILFLLPRVIPSNLKTGFVPIRTCKSKK